MRLSAPSFLLKKSAQAVLTFSPSGRLLAQVTNRVIIWDVQQRKVASQIKAISNEHHVACDVEDSLIAIKNTNGELAFCKPMTAELVSETGRFGENRMGCQPRFSSDGAYLVDGDWNGALVAWNPETAREMDRSDFPDCMITDIASCPRTGNFAVAINAKQGNNSGASLLILPAGAGLAEAERMDPVEASAAQGRVMFRRRGWRPIERLSFSPDGAELALVLGGRSAKDSQSLYLICLSRQSVLARIDMPTWRHSVWSISWSEAGRIAIVVKENMIQPGMAFQERIRAVDSTNHEFVEIYAAADLTLVSRAPFAGVSNAQYAPRSAGFAITSADTSGMYLQDDSMLSLVN